MASQTDQAALGPVSIPPGSFDTEKLAQGLDDAAKAKPEDRDAAIEDAFDKARNGTGTASADASLAPGHVYVEVDGPFGKERRQVFAPPKGDAKPEPEAEDPAKVEAAREKGNIAAVKAAVAAAQKEGAADPPAPADQASAPAPAAAPAGDKQ